MKKISKEQKKYYKLMLQAEQQSIWKYEMAVNIIKHLTLAYATERLRLLQEKESKWTAKDAVASGIKEEDVSKELLKLKDDIKREENIVKDANNRIEETAEMIRVTDGKMEFIRKVIEGQYN